jgi:hypothetical protein
MGENPTPKHDNDDIIKLACYRVNSFNLLSLAGHVNPTQPVKNNGLTQLI